MTGPYGITQFDAMGVMNAYGQARDNRIRQMVLQRQMEQAERQAERQDQFRTTLATAFARRPEASGTQASEVPARDATGNVAPPQASPMAAEPVPAAPMTTPMAPGSVAAPASTPPGVAQTGILPREVMMQLIAIDPEQATQVFGAFNAMNDAQHEQSERINAAIAREAQTMLNVPEAQRGQALPAAAARLQALGIPADQLANVPLTNQSLEGIINQVRDIEKIREEARPRLREVAGEVIDERMLPAATPGNPVVYESEFINTPQGMYRRSDLSPGPAQSLPRVATPQEAARLAPGTQFIDPQGNVRTVPGGPAPQAPGSFPVAGR